MSGQVPKDLLAVLKKYGLPDLCTAFKLEVKSPDEAVTLQFTKIVIATKLHEVGDDSFTLETRTFKLVPIETGESNG